MISFRSLRNGDLPQLLSIFRQHHQAYAVPVNVSLAQFEQAVLARTFFHPGHLLVAVQDDGGGNHCTGQTILGWCHFGAQQGSVQQNPRVSIAAICLASQCEASVAVELVEQAIAIARRLIPNDTDPAIYAGLVRDDQLGYTGLAPYSFGYGVENMDVRLHGVLQACGFVPDQALVRLTASTEGYRTAFSRQAMQWRRSTLVKASSVLPAEPRRAAALSHLDQERNELVDHGGNVLGAVNFFFSDAEAQVMSPSRALLHVSPDDQDGLTAIDSYLISTVAATLCDRGVYQIDAVVDAKQVSLINQLGKIGFTVAGEGTLWKCRSNRQGLHTTGQHT